MNTPKTFTFSKTTWDAFASNMLLFAAVSGLAISLVCNYIGFTSDAPRAWYFNIIGVLMAVIITALELYFNRRKVGEILANTEMWQWIIVVGALGAYLYGIYVNVLGLNLMMLPEYHGDIMAVLRNAPDKEIIPLLGGFFLEVLPEPMLLAWIATHATGHMRPSAHNVEPETAEVPQAVRDQRRHEEKQLQRAKPQPLDHIRSSHPARSR